MVQDLLLELAETGGGVEPELLEQVGTSLLVGAERLAPAALSGRARACAGRGLLPERVLAAQHLELGDELRGVPHRQLGVDPRFHCGEPELLETLRLELERERSAHVGIRVPAPEGERGPQSLSGFRRARLDQLPRLLDCFGELDCVDGAGSSSSR